METVVITVADEAGRHRVEEALQNVAGVTEVRIVDDVTRLAEPGLAEAWDSVEDQRWDELL